jgi:hypothetical protein
MWADAVVGDQNYQDLLVMNGDIHSQCPFALSLL